MVTAAINDDLFTREVTDDPYTSLKALPVAW